MKQTRLLRSRVFRPHCPASWISGVTAAFLLSACSIHASGETFWASRLVRENNEPFVETRSHLVSAKGRKLSILPSVSWIEFEEAGVFLSVRLQAERSASWQPNRDAALAETRQAARWIRQSSLLEGDSARLTLVAVEPGTALDITERGPSAHPLSLSLYAPIDARSDATVSTTLRGAFATMFHELVHAKRSPRRAEPTRRSEEYAASVFEACYLIDGVRGDDKLHLKQITRHSSSRALSESLAGANSAVATMQALAGGDVVEGSSTRTLARLRDFCARRRDTGWTPPIGE